MARYFFDVHDGVEIRDNGGTELPDIDAARGHALDLAIHFAREAIRTGSESSAVVVNVRDAAQSTVFVLRHVIDLQSAEVDSVLLAV